MSNRLKPAISRASPSNSCSYWKINQLVRAGNKILREEGCSGHKRIVVLRPCVRGNSLSAQGFLLEIRPFLLLMLLPLSHLSAHSSQLLPLSYLSTDRLLHLMPELSHEDCICSGDAAAVAGAGAGSPGS